VLPQVRTESPAASRGIAVHAYLADVVERGQDVALASVPDEHYDSCASIDLSRLPIASGKWSAEVRYEHAGVTGIADLVGLADGRAIVADWKTGDNVEPAGQNWQLRFLALAICRKHGLSAATVAIIYLRPTGPWMDVAELDAMDLDAIEGELADVLAKVEAAKAAEVPNVAEGSHCTYCPAYVHCPAKRALALALGSGDEVAEQVSALPLTPARVASAWHRLQAAKKLLSHVEAACCAAAKEFGPIDLGDGKELREVESTREDIDGAAAYGVLLKLHGNEAAASACEMSTSKAAIRRALKVISDESGEPLAGMERAALGAIREAGGTTSKITRSVRVVNKGASE
jgi:CRISPR/Cas system-associated exonuclease Cas4 (RecB family)